ncbi:MAG: right-handed parallel beta-helix repeat-containing protein, partial [Halobacteriota archaeon]
MSVLSAETTFLYVVCAMVVFAIAVPFVAAAPPPEPVDPTMTAGFDPGTAAAGVTAPDEEGTATIGDRSFDTAQAAIDAAEPGETIVLDGRFDERVTVEADAVKIIAGENGAVIDGGEQGRVLTVTGDRVAVEGVWITGSGYDVTTEDSGVYVDGNGTTLRSLRITDSAFGIWIDGVDDVTIADVRIEGRADVHPVTDRGNGIHLFGTNGTTVEDSEITDVRDGIYYSWASNVRASNNAMWNNRYGVHYMYSDDNQLVDNVAVDNGV